MCATGVNMTETLGPFELGKVHCVDCREAMRELPDESIQCVVTSPPYWGLRDYGTAQWEGGSAECDHIEILNLKRDCSGGVGGGRDKGTRGEQPSTSSSIIKYRDTCRKCGAIRVDRQLGLESTPAEYVEKMVALFREVRRVLKKDGTLWLNLGDSYAGGGRGGGGSFAADGLHCGNDSKNMPPTTKIDGLKPKDLCGIPWRVAFALQADGWWLRQDIIWAKPNPMPEFVTDRCTKAHEYVFLMTKSAKYFYDRMAICEPAIYAEQHANKTTSWGPGGKMAAAGVGKSNRENYEFTGENHTSLDGGNRNRRSVWTIATQPFSEAHFATFPLKLVEPCILAGSRPGDIILDPFMGAGTVGLCATKLNRQFIGFELNPEYQIMATSRIQRELAQGKFDFDT